MSYLDFNPAPAWPGFDPRIIANTHGEMTATELDERLQASPRHPSTVESTLAVVLRGFGKRCIQELSPEQRGFAATWLARVENGGLRAIPLPMPAINAAINWCRRNHRRLEADAPVSAPLRTLESV